MTKLIQRYVIVDKDDVVVESVDDMRYVKNPKLKVIDRKFKDCVIAVLANGDKDETFAMAQAVVDVMDNYPEDDTVIVDGDVSGDDTVVDGDQDNDNVNEDMAG